MYLISSENFMIEGYSFDFDAVTADLPQARVNDLQGQISRLVPKIP